MQRLKDIYPQYANEVDFYAVGVFPGEDIKTFEEYRAANDHPWPVAVPVGDLIPQLQVTVQSTKIAFDSRGAIIHRHSMGQGNPELWHEVFTKLAASG